MFEKELELLLEKNWTEEEITMINRLLETLQYYKKLIPKSDGGLIEYEGQVEVISSIDLEKKDIPNDLRWGVYVVIKAQNQYVKNCFKDYGMVTDAVMFELGGSMAHLFYPKNDNFLHLCLGDLCILHRKANRVLKFHIRVHYHNNNNNSFL